MKRGVVTDDSGLARLPEVRVCSRARKEGTRWVGGEGEKESSPGVRVGAAEGRAPRGALCTGLPAGSGCGFLTRSGPRMQSGGCVRTSGHLQVTQARSRQEAGGGVPHQPDETVARGHGNI